MFVWATLSIIAASNQRLEVLEHASIAHFVVTSAYLSCAYPKYGIIKKKKQGYLSFCFF